MQILCGLQVVFFLFNCQTPVKKYFLNKCKKTLPIPRFSFIIAHVVTLIAMKREVAAQGAGFSVERMSS